MDQLQVPGGRRGARHTDLAYRREPSSLAHPPHGRPGMTIQSGNADYPQVADVRHLRRYHVRRVAATIMAISPPIFCACLAGNSGNWDLFERSGSITTAIGLLVASRRYVQYGVLELAMLQARGPAPDAREMLEDILTAKIGLALSAFGTVIWGWGKYIGWWSFSCVLVWALFAARDVRRDSSKAGLVLPGEPAGSSGPKITRTG
jgi:hypothetical protein